MIKEPTIPSARKIELLEGRSRTLAKVRILGPAKVREISSEQATRGQSGSNSRALGYDDQLVEVEAVAIRPHQIS